MIDHTILAIETHPVGQRVPRPTLLDNAGLDSQGGRLVRYIDSDRTELARLIEEDHSPVSVSRGDLVTLDPDLDLKANRGLLPIDLCLQGRSACTTQLELERRGVLQSPPSTRRCVGTVGSNVRAHLIDEDGSGTSIAPLDDRQLDHAGDDLRHDGI